VLGDRQDLTAHHQLRGLEPDLVLRGSDFGFDDVNG
jgi:hypothetical protein